MTKFPFKQVAINETSCLTSEPGGAVGLGGWSVYAEALAGQDVAVLGSFHKEADLRQHTVQEARQHGCPSNHHQVLREHLARVNGALKRNANTHFLREENYNK